MAGVGGCEALGQLLLTHLFHRATLPRAMHIMTRHLLIELTKVFLFALAILTPAAVIVFLVQELMKQGVPLLQIGFLLPYVFPNALRVAIPVTLLLATTTVYARMSGYNEVVALKALGISPIVVLRPALVIGFLLSLLTVWLNDVADSWGRAGAKRVIVEAVEDIAYGMLRTERRFTSPRFVINVKRIDGRTLVRPTVSIQARGDTPAITIEAEEAELQADYRENLLWIRLRNGTIEFEGGVRMVFAEHKQEFPLSDASWAGQASNNPSAMPLRVFPEEIAKQREAIERHKQELAAAAAQHLLSGEFERLTGPEWDRRTNTMTFMHQHLCRLRLEPYRRWSAGFSCLCFVWVGAPMAVWRRNRDFLASFFLCFSPILIVYYPLLAYGIDGAKNGTIPPFAVWTGNVLLVLWGLWPLRRVLRY